MVESFNIFASNNEYACPLVNPYFFNIYLYLIKAKSSFGDIENKNKNTANKIINTANKIKNTANKYLIQPIQ